MVSDEAAATLRSMLVDAGASLGAPTHDDIERTWTVLRRFADLELTDADPRAADGDSLLAQWGTADVYEAGPDFDFEPVGQEFYLDLTRQLTFSEDGEYDHMTQLECRFDFALTPTLKTVGDGSVLSSRMDLDEFFTQARAAPGFVAVRAGRCAPLRLSVGYDEV